MEYYKVQVVYPNGEEEIIEEDFYSLNKAIESAKHLLGQVEYNASYHRQDIDQDGEVIKVEPYCLVKAFTNDGEKIVFDSRKK